MERETYQALCVAGHSVWVSRYGVMEEFPEDLLVPSHVVLGCLFCEWVYGLPMFSCFPGVSGFTICFVLFLCLSQFNFPRFTLWIFSITAHSHKGIMISIQFLHKPGARSIRIRCGSPELQLNQRMPP